MSSSIARTAPARMSASARLCDGLVVRRRRRSGCRACRRRPPSATRESRCRRSRPIRRVVRDVRGGPAVVDDQRQVLAREGHDRGRCRRRRSSRPRRRCRSRSRRASPGRRASARRCDRAARSRRGSRSSLKPLLKRREQPRAFAGRDIHAPARQRHRRLEAPGVQREARACGVDPRDARQHTRVFGLVAQRRRAAPAGALRGAGAVACHTPSPGSAGCSSARDARRSVDALDGARGAGYAVPRRPPRPTCGSALSVGPPLLGAVERVVGRLDLRHEPGGAVVAQPLDACESRRASSRVRADRVHV